MRKDMIPLFVGCALSACTVTPRVDLGLDFGAGSLSEPSSRPDDDFVEDSLDDVEVVTPDGQVEICVWDHQCEDGDAIRVTVDRASYDVVLRNDRDCRLFDLAPGQHEIGLLALNGTGYQGEGCSHADANTGAITVGPAGVSGNRQTWSHRGGTGSHATLWVTVR